MVWWRLVTGAVGVIKMAFGATYCFIAFHEQTEPDTVFCVLAAATSTLWGAAVIGMALDPRDFTQQGEVLAVSQQNVPQQEEVLAVPDQEDGPQQEEVLAVPDQEDGPQQEEVLAVPDQEDEPYVPTEPYVRTEPYVPKVSYEREVDVILDSDEEDVLSEPELLPGAPLSAQQQEAVRKVGAYLGKIAIGTADKE